ncbi:MAG: exodeoxyribonuclease VII large subunit [Planctomycetaceae bacterium]|nr:MAG: exodeoxyribonuclease VII large subunit [Planctomycetaceae bacterium]
MVSRHASAAAAPEILSIAQVTRQIKDAVEGNFPLVWVQGEISNLVRASSGHLYLTLKDSAAQLRAVMWRAAAARVKFNLHDGLEVIAAGPIEVYEARGSYQLMIEQLVPQGLGVLELAFRQLCEKLRGEWLSALERKRPLPEFPRRIALVTSPSGAAVRDMLQVLTRRWPTAGVVIIPVPVQGVAAAPQIAAALRRVGQIPEVDVVITGRGGGSLEDLWAFNEEVVARAIFDCPVPVVSAVGHEVDVTIADLVADRRALTPSEAAELVVPNREEIVLALRRVQERLTQGLRGRAVAARAQLDALAARRPFARPFDLVHDLELRLDELESRIHRAGRQSLVAAHSRLAATVAALQALSPLKVLERGYSVTRRADTGAVVHRAADAPPGTAILSLLSSGRLFSRVEEVLDEQ